MRPVHSGCYTLYLQGICAVYIGVVSAEVPAPYALEFQASTHCNLPTNQLLYKLLYFQRSSAVAAAYAPCNSGCSTL